MIPGVDPKPTISILSDIATVRLFVEKVRTSADQDKMALGFLPAAAYEEAANRGNLLVAKCGDAYAGHLLFGGSYPVLRVFQLYVVENFRRYGIGKQLIGSLTRFATKHGYLSISASVADDLPANRFWEKSGFVTVRTRPGG